MSKEVYRKHYNYHEFKEYIRFGSIIPNYIQCMELLKHLPPESCIVKLIRFLKNTPSPEGMVSKADGAGGTSSRVNHSSPSPLVPSMVKIIATVALGVAGLYCIISLSMEKSDIPG